jgi:alpha-ketoglutarate-dependent taurine dioxygenase
VQAIHASAAGLPLVIGRLGNETSGAHQFISAVRGERESLLAKLHASGALLFRGLSKLTNPEFARFAREFAGRELLSYVAGASPRTQLGEGVYTSTEYPSDFTLPLHNELSYTFEWPEYLFFYCVTPAAAGGETPLADSREILKRLDPAIVDRFRSRGIRYERRLDDGRENQYSWEAAFETDDRTVVENYCRKGDVEFRWNDDGSLSLSEIRPATAVHPKTGEEVWFNQADGFHPSVFGEEFYREYLSDPGKHRLRLNVRFADGGEIVVADLTRIRCVINELASPVLWQQGDVLVVDNMLACHGRNPFTGPRKILLAMA